MSIEEQDQQPDIRIAVDDFSTDGTLEILEGHGFKTHLATTSADDATTRIAQNFVQALRLARQAGADIVIVGDHDDVWHRDRIARQVQMLHENPKTAMLASDGFLIDDHGAAVPGTIRKHFPIPDHFNERGRLEKLSFASRHSVATGGACALRPVALGDWSVPRGWLHDRWWSLAALKADRFVADSSSVIDYRISVGQEVGLDTAQQEKPVLWLTGKARRAGSSLRKVRDLARLSRS